MDSVRKGNSLFLFLNRSPLHSFFSINKQFPDSAVFGEML